MLCITETVDPLTALAQYGIVGTVFAVVIGLITIPLLRSMMAQNRDALELLRQAVATNTKAVESFQRLESAHSITSAQVNGKLDQLLAHK